MILCTHRTHGSLRKSNEKSQIRLLAVLRDAPTPNALEPRVPTSAVHGDGMQPCTASIRTHNSNAFALEACRKTTYWTGFHRRSPSMRQNICRAAWRRAASAPFAVAAFPAAFVMPPAHLVAHVCIVHVLTAVRSSRALRLWTASQFLRPSTPECRRRWLLMVLDRCCSVLQLLLRRSKGIRCARCGHHRGALRCQWPPWSACGAPWRPLFALPGL